MAQTNSAPERSVRWLLTLYSRTPVHVGCGATVETVDLPIQRERVTHYPVVPDSGLKGVLRQAGREFAGSEAGKLANYTLGVNDTLFGVGDEPQEVLDRTTGKKTKVLHPGCLQILQAKLLAFPVRSVAGAFAWITCPSALLRFQRDTGDRFEVPPVKVDTVVARDFIKTEDTRGTEFVVLEEYALPCRGGSLDEIDAALLRLCDDSLWQRGLAERLCLLADENFQFFVSECTEVNAHIAIDPLNRVTKQGSLRYQEDVPCESLFYTVITLLPERRKTQDAASMLQHLLQSVPLLQIGADETTGHGICTAKPIGLPLPVIANTNNRTP